MASMPARQAAGVRSSASVRLAAPAELTSTSIAPNSFSTRSKLLPDVPTMQQAGVKDFQFTQWLALLAPAHTPRDVVMRVNGALRSALGSKEMIEKFNQQGFDAYLTTPEEAGKFIASEVQRFAKVIKSRKITAE